MQHKKNSAAPAPAPVTSGEELLSAHAELHTLCHGCGDPVAVVSLPQGTVLEANREFRELVGVSEPLPADLTIPSLGGPDLGRMYRHGQGLEPRVVRKVSLAGISGRARLFPIPATFPVQAFLEFVPSAARARSRERRLKQMLEERLQQIRNFERLRSLGETAAVILHEIRIPLSSIRLGVEMTRNARDLPEGLHPRLDLALEQLGRLDRLLDSIRTFANPLRLEIRSADVRELLSNALRSVEPSMDGSRMESVIEVRPDPLRLEGDPDRLAEAISNLILNAAEAVGEKRRVWLRAAPSSRRAGWIDIRVTDLGRGIPPALMARMFQPFFTTKRTGTGLGLAIVKKIIELHGGFVSLKSAPGKGTTVLLELPSAGTRTEEPLAHPDRRR